MWHGLVAPLKHLKVYIKIVKQQLSENALFWGVKVLVFLLFNDKKIRKYVGVRVAECGGANNTQWCLIGALNALTGQEGQLAEACKVT